MANEQNLRPFTSDQSREEAVKNGRIGGKKSGESRRKRKSMKENFQMLLELQILDPTLIKKLKAIGVPDEELTYQSALNIARLNQALSGNVKAIDSCDELLDEGIKSKQLKETKRSNRAKEKIMAEAATSIETTTKSVLSSKMEAMFEQCEGQRGLSLDE